MRHRRIAAAIALFIGLVFSLHLAAQYRIDGWPIKKQWGPLRTAYFDPAKRELRMVFEDAAGTIRIVTVDPDTHTAVPVAEFSRQ